MPLLALFFALMCGVIGLFSGTVAIALLLSVGVAGYLHALLMRKTTRPSPAVDLPPDDTLRDFYHQHFFALLYPRHAAALSQSINVIRIAGLASIPFLAYGRIWWGLVGAVVYFFWTGLTCVVLHPAHYYGAGAAKGDEVAAEALAKLGQLEVRLRFLRANQLG